MATFSGAERSSQSCRTCTAWLARAQNLRFAALKALQAYERPGGGPPLALSDLARRLGVLPYELFRAFRVAGGYRRCWEDFLRLWREL